MSKIRTVSIGQIETYSNYIDLENAKSKEKFIKGTERIIRSSDEYKSYIKFLKEYVDMTKCAFFNGVTIVDKKKIHIEIHHAPLTLFEITMIVVDKWLAEGIPINDLLIADEVMRIHYNNKVGLIPLSKTVHQLVQSEAGITIPLYMIYGSYVDFLKEYQDYIMDDRIFEKLQYAIQQTKNLTHNSFDMLNPEFIYIETDGVEYAKTIEKDDEDVNRSENT